MKRPVLNHFHTYAEICEYLRTAQKEYPDVMQLDELAITEEGRVIWGVTLSKGNPDAHPALYVQGGVHAQEGMGITCSLNFLWTILENQDILDKLTVYIVPCVNPDGSDMCVRTGVNVRSKLERIYGLTNAIVPQDLDGDGKILSMRWQDPKGYWVALPECGNMMVPRRPGDKGPFYQVYTEGIVENYDGGDLQNGYRDLDFNRQYAMNWKDNANGGDFPARHIEPRTVMSFLCDHPNIFAVIDVHCGTRALIYSDPSNREDRDLMRKIARMAKEICDIEPITHGRYGRSSDSPSFTPYLCGHVDDFCYNALGIPSVTVELGNGYNSLGMNSYDIFDADLYGRDCIAKVAAMHAAKGSKIAEPWVPFKHPQLGDVEVGGQFHYNAYFMDPDDMLDLIPKVADYCLAVADLVPTLIINDVQCAAVGDGIYRINAQAMNDSYMSTKPMQAPTSFHTMRDCVSFEIAGVEEILSTKANPSVAALDPLATTSAEWFVRAKSGDAITVSVKHPKAIGAEMTVIAP